MKNRTMIGIVCIVLAAIVTFGAAPLVNRMSDGRTEIIRMTTDVKQGFIITESDIEKAPVGSFNLSANVIKDKAAVVGKYAATDLKAGDYLMDSKLSNEADSADSVFRLLDGTKQAVSISIGSFAAGLSGKLHNGDVVSIMITSTEKNEAEMPAALRYVKVITTTTASGTDRDKLTANENGANELPATVTLLVNMEQAKMLAQYEAKSKIHISLVYRGDTETAQKFLDAQDEYLKKNTMAETEVIPYE